MKKEVQTYANMKSAKQSKKTKAMKNPEFLETPEGRIMVREKGSALYDASLRVKSEVDSPVKLVWDLCFNHPNAKRRDIVAMAIEAGVSLNTARTQYQYWRKAAGLVRSPKHA